MESVAANRARLKTIIGAVDVRRPCTALEFVSDTNQPALVGRGDGYEVYAVRWPVLRGVDGEGLLLKPTAGPSVVAACVAVPDADQTPEMLAGLTPGIAPEAQFARRLAESRCVVLIPCLIDRRDTFSGLPGGPPTNQPHREWIYRPAFEMGRHIIGYEVQKILAAVDWFSHEAGTKQPAVGVMGYGEGGLLALHAGALDPRINAVCVSGYFDARQSCWQEPIYRNVWSLLHEFGDAELASLIAPRTLIVEACRAPEIAGPPPPRTGRRGSAAPGRLTTPDLASVQQEFKRAQSFSAGLAPAPRLELVVSDHGTGPAGCPEALAKFLDALAGFAPAPSGNLPAHLRRKFDADGAAPSVRSTGRIYAAPGPRVGQHSPVILVESRRAGQGRRRLVRSDRVAPRVLCPGVDRPFRPEVAAGQRAHSQDLR